MKKHFLILLIVATAFAPISVAAQENETETGRTVTVTVASGDTEETEAMTYIDDHTRLVSKEFKDGRLVMVVQSDKTQSVTITDAVGVMQEQYNPRERVVLREGMNRIEYRAATEGGTAAVTIDTGILFPVVVEKRTIWVGGPYEQGDVQNAALAGLSSGLLLTFAIARRRVKGSSDKPERIL